MAGEPLPVVMAALSEGRTFEALPPVDPLGTGNPIFSEVAGVLRHNDGRGLEELLPLLFSVHRHPVYIGFAMFTIGATHVCVGVTEPEVRSGGGGPGGAGGGGPDGQPRERRLNKDPLTEGLKSVAASRQDATLELNLQYSQFAVADDANKLDAFITGCLQVAPTETESHETKEQRLQGLADAVLEALKAVIRAQEYPGARIAINCLVLTTDGSELFSALLNCATLALVDAGIQLNDIVSGATVFAVQQPELPPVCCLGLTGAQLTAARTAGARVSTVHMAMLPNLQRIAYLSMVGPNLKYPLDQQLLKLAEAACVGISRELGKCVIANHSPPAMLAGALGPGAPLHRTR